MGTIGVPKGSQECEGPGHRFMHDHGDKEKCPFSLKCDSGGHHNTRGEKEKVYFKSYRSSFSCIKDTQGHITFLS